MQDLLRETHRVHRGWAASQRTWLERQLVQAISTLGFLVGIAADGEMAVVVWRVKNESLVMIQLGCDQRDYEEASMLKVHTAN